MSLNINMSKLLKERNFELNIFIAMNGSVRYTPDELRPLICVIA